MVRENSEESSLKDEKNQQEEDDEEEEELTPEEEEANSLCENANKLLEQYEAKADSSGEENPELLTQALEQIDKALSLDSSNIDSRLTKAYILGLQDKLEEGEKILDEARQLSPEDSRINEMAKELEQIKLDNSKEELKEDQIHGTANGIPLLVENGVMTKRFYEVLMKIFKYYDEDNDGTWNKKELNNFHVKVNGQPVSEDTITFLRQHFDKNSKGHITLQGLLEFYLAQTSGDATETWNDLKELGFGKDLQELDDRYEKKTGQKK